MIWNDTFEELRRIQKEMEQYWQHMVQDASHPLLTDSQAYKPGSRLPLTDIRETESNILAIFEIPGAQKDNIQLNLTKDHLELDVKRAETQSVNQEGAAFQARREATYYRSFQLPKDIDPTKSKAQYKDGVLRIEMPKTAEGDTARRIQIE